ncbi:uncharacterized protein LOC109719410 isoform X2 [Ananas comosus]|uniref:Uncharacterized protein LOC109719410 isoform X2 n=1 Tax=Ananas comosus TaxID=4615 RepID=A0A6P5G8T9_ANACO|nr:uncharacterized protein LOC109719410 isoform X2 [Ananas comosus]
MAAAAMATAAGTAVLLYLVLSGRLSPAAAAAAAAAVVEDGEERGLLRGGDAAAEEEEEEEEKKKKKKKGARKGRGRWPDKPPATWGEAAAIAARTVRFTYSETLGKWPLGEIAFGIKYYMKQQGSLQHEYAGSNCVQLKGQEILTELINLLRYLRLCMFFSKKPFQVFLEFGGYNQDDVLIQKSKARLLKPAFTVVCDKSSKCFLLLIRGAISVKDRLTAATGAEVPFHHIVLREGRINNLVLGYAHCGMVAAARWIAKHAIPSLSKAVQQFPDYKIKIIGHSMGAGIAAILTYILRENEKFSSCTCIAFGPAACMTWELAESGKDFITTLVNKNDLVPSFSKVSAENLRFQSATNRSGDATRSTNGHSTLSCWSCIGARRRAVSSARNPNPVQDCVFESIMTSQTNTGTRKVENAGYEPVVAESASGSSSASDDEEKHPEDKAPASLKEIAEEEAALLKEAELNKREARQLYPPGRIMHMVVLPSSDSNPGEDANGDEFVGIYETPRELYGKIRLARSMIREHYMPRYIKTMELLIEKLGKDESECTSSL